MLKKEKMKKWKQSMNVKQEDRKSTDMSCSHIQAYEPISIKYDARTLEGSSYELIQKVRKQTNHQALEGSRKIIGKEPGE